MARHTSAFFNQFGHFCRSIGRFGWEHCPFGFSMRLIVGTQVGHVLLSQVVTDAAHGGVLAIALFVGAECRGDVLGALAGNFRDLVDFRETRLVALNAMTADAHCNLLLPGLGIALNLCCLAGKDGRAGDK